MVGINNGVPGNKGLEVDIQLFEFQMKRADEVGQSQQQQVYQPVNKTVWCLETWKWMRGEERRGGEGKGSNKVSFTLMLLH